jgi:hypothetical protein
MIKCPTCKSEYQNPVDCCSKCGYPFNGTDQERSSFVAQQIIKGGHIDDAKNSLKSAKAILFVIGAVNIIFSVLSGNVSVIITGGIVGLGFIVFGFVVERSPFLFLVIPLSLLLLLYLADALFDPMTLIRGIGWKIAYITSLSYAIVRVKRAEKIKKESEYLSSK